MGNYPKDNYHRGEDWHKRHRYPSKCAKCGKGGQKSTMPALYVRKNSYDSHRILCRICPDCLPGFLDGLGVKMPE